MSTSLEDKKQKKRREEKSIESSYSLLQLIRSLLSTSAEAWDVCLKLGQSSQELQSVLLVDLYVEFVECNF